jgi:predicted phage terminase large subunit-like protein
MVATLDAIDLAGLDRAGIERLLPFIPEDERPFVMDALASLTPPAIVETPVLSLAEFVREAWPILEPGTPYLHNWHIDLVSELLMAITRGEVANAVINVPPRFMKSLLVSVFWPAWEWTMRPSLRYVTGSYAMDLAMRDTVNMRYLVESAWYQERWGHLVRLADDQNQKTRFHNTARGQRIAVSVGSRGTGEGGDRVIVDDPINAEEAKSRLKRERAIGWWRRTLSTRANNPLTMAKILVMQRLHDNDLTGHVLNSMKEEGAEHFEHLVVPMEHERNRMVPVDDKPWTKDPRTEEGELAWEDRFPRKVVEALKVTLGSDYAGQEQQRPVAEGGGIYETAWWAGDRNRYLIDDGVLVKARWLMIDTAFKENQTNDYSACTLFELTMDYRLRVRPLWNERLPSPRLVERIERTAEEWRRGRDGRDLLLEVVIEDKGSGTSAIQTIQAGARRWLAARIIAFMPSGDKEYRARQAATWCERGMILLPYADERIAVLYELEYQLEHMPAVEHDDLEDTFSMGIIYLEHMVAKGWQARLRRMGVG